MKFNIFIPFFLVAATVSVHAVNIATWTFEVNTPADSTDSATSPTSAADSGNGTASGIHASAATDWTTPAGNGSANSFSANNWAVGDYWQFQVSTIGYQDIVLSWDQAGSSTGPKDFKLQYSINGTTFTDFATYAVLENAGSPNGPGAWNATTPHTEYGFSYDLSAVGAIENVAALYLRLIDISTVAIRSTSPVATAGTDRVDNFIVTASVIPTDSVPETLPFGFAAITFLVVLGLGYRVRRQTFNA